MTANSAPPVPITFTAESAITAYRFVKLGAAANGVTAVTAQGEVAMGVAGESQASGEAVSVWPLNRGGIVPVEAAAAISVGDDITTQSDGRGMTSASLDNILGVALEAASGAGHIIPVLVKAQGETTP